MKKLFGIVVLIVLFSCEKDKCYVCETRSDVNTTSEAVTSKEVYLREMEIGPRYYENQHSYVAVKVTEAGPYYSQTITKCREK